MPIYLYRHPFTGEVREVFQNMNDEHSYSTAEADETIHWNRVFTKPNAGIDTQIDPESAADFVNVTANKKGTLGNLDDLSQELSDKRARIYGGEDPVRRKKLDDYAKKRGGRKHFKDRPKKFENEFVSVDLN